MTTIDNYNFNGKKPLCALTSMCLWTKTATSPTTPVSVVLSPPSKKILNDGGSLIIMSHMGKPKGKVNPQILSAQIKDDVAKALGKDVKFAPDCANAAEAAANLKPGEVLLLENLRFYPEEEGKPVGIEKTDAGYDAAKKEMKEKQKEFAKTLCKLC